MNTKERVEAGCAFLDEVIGPSWVDEINTDTLDIDSGCQCIAAQVVGRIEAGYLNAWERAMFEWGVITPTGSEVPGELVTVDLEKARRLGLLGHDMTDSKELEEAWVEVIEQRLHDRVGLPA